MSAFGLTAWTSAPVKVALAAVTIGAASTGCEPGHIEGPAPPPPTLPQFAEEFSKPESCKTCHPMHFEEWQGSVMHYAAISPVFRAFELTMRSLSQGAFAANGQHKNFCIGCHSPTGDLNDELPPFVDQWTASDAFADLSAVSQEGLSCDFCHTVTGPDLEKSFLNDGIGNVSLLFGPSDTKFGPLTGPVANTYHASTQSDYLQTPEFCGACHDVRIPVPDPVTGEPFQRLENLFTEWQEGPYNSTDNPYGRVVRCQDCHMSMYPQTEPGVFPTAQVATTDGSPPRKHAIHAFTAVSIPFVDDPRMPNIYGEHADQFGYPQSQQARREQMLRAAVTMHAEQTPTTIAEGSETIPVVLTLTNVGAGHRVPSGFSQEREVWVELTVQDDEGIFYTSGHLHDKPHPETGELVADGRTHDEDLEHRHFEIDLETLDSQVSPGPDTDLVSFTNRFVRIGPDGSWETVINPLLAQHMDNSHSLDMLVPTEAKYDVPVPERGLRGDVKVSARLRYRAFPPELLRVLAVRHPELVDESIVDRNTIVDMVETSTTITITDTRPTSGEVIFTEIMFHTSHDSDAEWFELHNVGDRVVNLAGCTLSDDDGDDYAIPEPTRIAPGEYRLFGHPETGIRLGNTYGDALRLDCGTQRIDTVNFYQQGFPNTRDRSLTLDPSSFNATDNNLGANWCDATTVYNVEVGPRYGTPGLPNDRCR